jgi:hypothetical protein
MSMMMRTFSRAIAYAVEDHGKDWPDFEEQERTLYRNATEQHW